MWKSSIDLQNFFPKNQLKVVDILEDKTNIKIKLKSKTVRLAYPKCNTFSDKHHGTYMRKVQDIPILVKQVLLEINSYEYRCENSKCFNKTIVESFDGFISYYSRITERLSDFYVPLH